MSYRKFRADHLFTGHKWLNANYVLIASQEGEIVEILPVEDAGEGIEYAPGILSPGFVNCHCHLELSHMKGMIPRGTGMVDFLIKVIKGRGFEREVILQAIADAEAEMLMEGIVAVGDICNTADTIHQKEQGMLYYHNFIEAIGFVEATAQQRFDAALSIYQQFARLYRNPEWLNSIVPHAPYSVSPKLFQLISKFPPNQLICMHNQESLAENEFMQAGTGDFRKLFEALGIDLSNYQPIGKRSLPFALPFFSAVHSLILVHDCTINEEDLHTVLSHPGRYVSFCLCPNANQYIGNPLPDIDLLRNYNAEIVLGTDSLASNSRLSILSELRTLHQQRPDIHLFELFQWATLNGARALQLDTDLGSFDAGKQPGILLINNDLTGVERLV